MVKALLAAVLVMSAAAAAQTAAAPAASSAAPAAVKPVAAPAAKSIAAPADLDEVRRDMDQKLESQKQEIKELREEIRAQLATQSAAQGWQEEWVEEKRKLELFEPNGYLRLRPDLFNKLDLGRANDPWGYALFPRANGQRTIAGANMRFRFEPTLNVSEEVRLKVQVDALDNVVFGSNPEYAFSRGAGSGYAYDRNEFTLFSETQVPPRSGINALQDSVAVKRVYGEVSTPIGILRFGRMGSHWGLGMLHNDGNCIDCDHGDTVDRVMFVAEPLPGYYVTPMLDFNAEGPTSARQSGGGQPFDLSNNDDTHSFVLAAARRDTDQQARAKLENNLSVFNYGVHFTYRVQRNDPADFTGAAFQGEGTDAGGVALSTVPRNGSLYIPDVWLKFERKVFRLELEAAAVLGSIGNRATTSANAENLEQNQGLSVVQFGATAQGEYRFMEGALRLQLEVGFASGDKSPGFGNYPRRRNQTPGATDTTTPPVGLIDGPQYSCGVTCSDSAVRNFRFNRDYRIDMILWREILGSVTDAVYIKPTLSYKVAEGFNLFGSVIYSRSVYAESTPSWNGLTGDNNLGIEINAGARYETEDGFFGQVAWGILFPLGGLADTSPTGLGIPLDTAQAVRGSIGIKF